MNELAFVDCVTKLPNRNYFEHDMRNRFYLAQDIGVLLIEPDHFKQYSDLFGCFQGDIALKTVGKEIKGLYKNVCLYNSQQFLAVVENCDGQLRDWAEDTQAVISSLTIPRSVFARIPCHELYPLIETISVSIGGAKRRQKESLDSVIARADSQLYLAKKKRACIRVAL